jgi:cell division protein ZapA
MSRYNLTLLGQKISFKTNAEEKRIREAEKLIEHTYTQIRQTTTRVSTEKVLIMVALALADDYLQSNQELENVEKRLAKLLEKIDNSNSY